MSEPKTRELEARAKVGNFTFSNSSATTLDSYRSRLQDFADEREWNQYHTPRNLMLALTGEVGELAEIFQWKGDDQCDVGLPAFSEKDRTKVEDEMADVFAYLVRMATVCHVDLPAAVERKMAKNAAKYPKDLVKGSSAKYNEYAQNHDGVAVAGEQGSEAPPVS